jgi:Ca2+-binding EF-hand superfamily protein
MAFNCFCDIKLISTSKMQEALKNFEADLELTDIEISQLITQFDKDGDGNINYEEFKELILTLVSAGILGK